MCWRLFSVMFFNESHRLATTDGAGSCSNDAATIRPVNGLAVSNLATQFEVIRAI